MQQFLSTYPPANFLFLVLVTLADWSDGTRRDRGVSSSDGAALGCKGPGHALKAMVFHIHRSCRSRSMADCAEAVEVDNILGHSTHDSVVDIRVRAAGIRVRAVGILDWAAPGILD